MASNLVALRDLIESQLALKTPNVDPNKKYKSAGKLTDLPSGGMGHRMFVIEGPSGGAYAEDGADQAQMEHNFTITVRLNTPPLSQNAAFDLQVNTPVEIMNFLDNLDISSVTGADALISQGYENEEAEEGDTDVVISFVAYIQETDE